MTKKMNSINLEDVLNSSKANIIYLKENQVENIEKFIEKNIPYCEENLLNIPVVSLLAKFGQSFLNLIAENLEIKLLGMNLKDNYFEVEKELAKIKTKVVVIKDIHNLLYSLESIDRLAMVSQIIFLNKRLKISFVLIGKIDSSLLEIIKEEFSNDLKTL